MLKPTSANKMFNAKVRHQNLQKEWAERTMLPTSTKAIKRNWNNLEAMLNGAKLHDASVSFDLADSREAFDVVWSDVPADKVLTFLESYAWLGSNQHLLRREIDFAKGTGDRNPGIDHWLLIAPQRKISRGDLECAINGKRLSVFRRNLVDGQRVGVITEPLHRILAEYAALGRRRDDTKPPISNISPSGRKLYRPKQAVMLLYPLKTQDDGPRHAGFALFFPANSIITPLVFGVADPKHRNAAIITANS
jgi:hypothetical protein